MDVKSLLKAARKYIDEHKYKDAQNCCKIILREDKQNYLALILLGKSLQDNEQAPLAYQKAIACKRDNVLAWQGLASYYEKNDLTDKKSNLISVYGELLKLQIEEVKALEILNKTAVIGCLTKNPLAIRILMNFILSNNDAKLLNKAGYELTKVLRCNIPYNSDNVDIDKLINALKKLYENEPGDSYLELKIVQTMTLRQMPVTSIMQDITNLQFSTHVVKEWLCQYIFTNYMEKGEKIIEFDNITNGIEGCKYAGLLKSALFYEQGCYLEAFKLCVSLVNYTKPIKCDTIFIMKCTIMLKKWSVTEKLAISFLNKVIDREFQNELKKYLFIALAKQYKWEEAYSVAVKSINVGSLQTDQQALLAECYIQMNRNANDIMRLLNNTEYYLPLTALKLIKNCEYNEVITLLENNVSETNHGLIFYYLALAYWELKTYDKCHVNLLKAAKLDSNFPLTFLYLGHYYKKCSNDFRKARKCYEKANNILPFNNDITKSLSELYVKLGLKELNHQFLSTLENSALKESVWVNYRLGLHYLNNRDWDKAILKFKNVIKVDSKNATAFECLADAYFSRGSYKSALKAYDKAIVLNPKKASHCLSKIGNIHTLLTQFPEAIAKFEEVFKIDPEYISALKGISETWIKVAEKKASFNLYGSARDSAQNAINYIIRTVNVGKQFSSLYKIFGDALIFITTLPTCYSYVYIQDLFHDTKEQRRIEKVDIFTYAIACYSRVMKLKNDTTSFDLATAYLSLYMESNRQGDLQKALNLALDCIKKKSGNWHYWNLLGKVFFHLKKYHLAQHCFIKAIQLTRKLPIAKVWCNLGTLYLKLQLHMLANFCFWRGQSALPSYPQSWIGQGLIAEHIREKEAMDLFRHASRLGYHRESALAYSDWVCRKLKTRDISNPEFVYEIYGLYAIPYSADLMQWYCRYENKNACAHVILGILQERLGLLESAKQSYEIALQNAEDNKKNMIRLNLGRILLRLKKYDESISAYRDITEANLNSLCGLALSLFKRGIYEEAYSTYDMALHWVTEDAKQKLEIMVAMASIMYVFKGPTEAKMLLFQSIQLSRNQPSPYCLFASCALGILHSEENLSKLALKTLKKHERDPKYSCDIGFLKSYMCIHESRLEEAICSISDTIYNFPNKASLWFYLAQYSLRLSNTRWASVCAQRAMRIATSQSVLDDNSGKMFATASICEAVAGNQSKAIHIAKKALHVYPYDPEILAALIFSLSKNITADSNRRQWLMSAASCLKRHLNPHHSLSKWAAVVEEKMMK